MKAISIMEPAASMILDGRKTIEVRSYPTKHRGKLLLCACKTPKGPLSGTAFAVATLADCRPLVQSDAQAAGFKPGVKLNLDQRWAWLLEDIKPVEPRRPVRGQVRIFNVDFEVDEEETAKASD